LEPGKEKDALRYTSIEKENAHIVLPPRHLLTERPGFLKRKGEIWKATFGIVSFTYLLIGIRVEK